MISVVIATLNDERRLAGTLAPLVEAAVDGLVRQVIIADAGSTDATLEVADDAGATIVSGDLAAGVGATRQDWLLILDAGARLQPGWERVLHAHMKVGSARAGRIGPVPARGLAAWLSSFGPKPVLGLLTPKALIQGPSTSLADLAKSLRTRLTPLGIGAIVEP